MNDLLRRLRTRAVRAALPLLVRANDDDTVRLGSDYGGWWVPRAVVRPGSVCYCAGAGEDITFDESLLAAGCRVVTIDPTPRAIAHVAARAPQGDFTFVPEGLGGKRTVARFYAPRDATHVSHSVKNLQRTDSYFEAQLDTVPALMDRLGDDRVDLLKLDIEGAEHDVLDSLHESGVYPAVLCVEFDQPDPFLNTLRAVRRLRRAGYVVRKVEGFNVTLSRSGR